MAGLNGTASGETGPGQNGPDGTGPDGTGPGQNGPDGTGPGGAGLILVVNAGSSSLKLGVLDPAGTVVAAASPPASRGLIDKDQLHNAIASFPPVQASGHRVVHGGTMFQAPVRVTERVRAGLDELTSLAPLHQPACLAALDQVTEALPGIPAVACFDTAFHAGLPEPAVCYPLPRTGPARSIPRWGSPRWTAW